MKLEALAAAIIQAAQEAVASACAEVSREAKTLCPVESGRLRASIGAHEEAGEVGVTGQVTASAPYAPMVELGTVKQSARPFLQPAFAQAKGRVAAEIASRLRSAL